MSPAICAGLAAHDTDWITTLARKRQIHAKSALFFEMDPAKYVYEVTEGILKVSRTAIDGRR